MNYLDIILESYNIVNLTRKIRKNKVYHFTRSAVSQIKRIWKKWFEVEFVQRKKKYKYKNGNGKLRG